VLKASLKRQQLRYEYETHATTHVIITFEHLKDLTPDLSLLFSNVVILGGAFVCSCYYVDIVLLQIMSPLLLRLACLSLL